MQALLNVKNYEMFVDIIIHLFGRCCHHLCAIDGRNIVVALLILLLNMRSAFSLCVSCVRVRLCGTKCLRLNVENCM